MARAKVTLSIEILIGGGAWGPECTVGQVHKQAWDAVHNRLRRLCNENPDIKTYDEPKVHMITTDLDNSA